MVNTIFNIILACACLNAVALAWDNDCSVRVRGDMSTPTPLILNADSYEFIVPNHRADVVVKSGESVKLFCSDGFRGDNRRLLTATCLNGANFIVDGDRRNFRQITCNSWPEVSAEKTGEPCNGGELIKVGFRIDDNHFAEQMQVCFDSAEEVTRYVKYTLGPYSKYFQSRVDRPDFEQLSFFGDKNVQGLYTKRRQQQTFSRLLDTSVSKYYRGQNHFLARGHIAAKADFVFGGQERGTFVFINVAPQWQSINAGNWNDIEQMVRDLANQRRSSLSVISGVYGVTTLPDNRGHPTPLYLSVDRNNNNQIPVPMLYFRIVVEKESNLGVALITLNNPYLSRSQIENEYTLCEDISNQLSYFNIKDKTDPFAGYTYACTVSDFLKSVENVPEVRVSGLLD